VSGWHIGFGVVLAAGLLFLGVFYFRRQLRALHRLKTGPTLPDEETRYWRRQAWWRLVGSGLLVVLAVLLPLALIFLEPTAHDIAEYSKAMRDAGEEPIFSPAQRLFVKVYSGFWIAYLLILLVVLMLAAVDLWTTRRYGLRQHRRLQADRRAMIERQVNRMRQERNERN